MNKKSEQRAKQMHALISNRMKENRSKTTTKKEYKMCTDKKKNE
jgi:hypothetical protein